MVHLLRPILSGLFDLNSRPLDCCLLSTGLCRSCSDPDDHAHPASVSSITAMSRTFPQHDLHPRCLRIVFRRLRWLFLQADGRGTLPLLRGIAAGRVLARWILRSRHSRPRYFVVVVLIIVIINCTPRSAPSMSDRHQPIIMLETSCAIGD